MQGSTGIGKRCTPGMLYIYLHQVCVTKICDVRIIEEASGPSHMWVKVWQHLASERARSTNQQSYVLWRFRQDWTMVHSLYITQTPLCSLSQLFTTFHHLAPANHQVHLLLLRAPQYLLCCRFILHVWTSKTQE